MEIFQRNIENYKVICEKIWWECSSEYELKGEEVSLKNKIINEKKVTYFIDKLLNDLKKCPSDVSKQIEWREAIWVNIRSFCKEAGVTDTKLEEEFIDSLVAVTHDFMIQLKKFDPSLKLTDVGQAVRNLWIMNILQWIFGIEIEHRKSMFGYSMLYPYSDNFIDDKDISKDDKNRINMRFREKIYGENLKPENHCEEGLFKLIDYIEKDYERKGNQEIYESLLAIHTGQTKSMRQHEEIYSPYERNILDVSIEKGGTSVLADGYLVRGELSREQAFFSFIYGVMLQFCDDLQDAYEDSEDKSSTIFSQTIKGWELDRITNKLFNFLEATLSKNNDFISNRDINSFLYKNIRFLIIEAISHNVKLYSKDYIDKITKISMCRLSYTEKLYKNVRKKFENFKSDNGHSFEEIFFILTDVNKA